MQHSLIPPAKILVVEAEPQSLLLTAQTLGKAGHQVVEARSGSEALRLAREHKPELVLLNVAVSDMDGIDVCRVLKHDSVYDGCLVALVSNETGSSSQIEERLAEADEYLSRPISDQALLARVRALLRIGRAEKRLQRQHNQSEKLIQERTAELTKANQHLRQEIAELREREALFRAVIESEGEGVGIVDPDELFVFANPAAENVFGVPAGTLLGRRITEFTDADGAALIHSETQKRMQGIKSTYEHDIVRPDGQRRRLLVTVTPRFDDDGQFLGAFGVFRDITERVEMETGLHQVREDLEQRILERAAELVTANQSLQQRNRELGLLNQAAQAFGSELDLDQVVTMILERIPSFMDVTASSLWLLDTGGDMLVCAQTMGFGSEYIKGWCLPAHEGIAGWALQHRQSLNIADTRLESRHFAIVEPEAEKELRSILAVPLQVKGFAIGVLEVLHELPGRFSDTDRVLLELLAASAATAIENGQLYRRLDHARQQWAEIFQAIGHPALLLDPETTVLTANRAAMELTKDMPGTLVGKKCYDVFHCSSAQSEGCPVAELVAGGRFQTVEMEMEALDGVFLVSCTPVLNEQQQLQQIIHIATDISDLKRAEASLQESRVELERRNQALVITNEISATIRQSLHLQQMMQDILDKLLDLTPGDAGWIAFFNPEHRQTFSVVAQRGVNERVIAQLEQMWIDARLLDLFNQAEWPIVSDETWAYPAIDVQAMGLGESFGLVTVPIQARERFLGVLSVFIHRPDELTAYEKDLFVAVGQQAGMAMENMQLLEDAAQIQLLRELDRLRSELIANASHELRTPLGLIKIFVTALLMEDVEFSEEKRLEFLTGIEDETSKLEAIVDNLLDLGRMESGRLRLERHPVDLANLVRRTALVMKPNMAAHELLIDLPETPLVANVDVQRIEQVLRNLISNAIKYSPDGGQIAVRGYQKGGQIQIDISDEGIGISEEDQSKIFERFYRVENEITSRVRGAGLGLSICKWLVEAHDGQISVHSTLDEGSVFSVVLPVDVQ